MTTRPALIRTMGVLIASAVLIAASDHSREEFRLAIVLKAQYNPALTVCTLVRTDEPFSVVLASGNTNTILSGKLEKAKQDIFALQLDVSQGSDEHGWISDSGVYKLKLDAAVGRPIIIERQNHPTKYEREIVLTKGICPSLK